MDHLRVSYVSAQRRSYTSLFSFLPFSLPLSDLPTPWRCRGLLSHLITMTHTHSVGLLWMRDRPVAENTTWQHTTYRRDQHPLPRRNSNPQSQQTSGRRPTPLNAWPLGGWPCFCYVQNWNSFYALTHILKPNTLATSMCCVMECTICGVVSVSMGSGCVCRLQLLDKAFCIRFVA